MRGREFGIPLVSLLLTVWFRTMITPDVSVSVSKSQTDFVLPNSCRSRGNSLPSEAPSTKDLSHSRSAEISLPSKSHSPKRKGLFSSKSFEARFPLSEKPREPSPKEEKEKKGFILRSPFSRRKKGNESPGGGSEKSPKSKHKETVTVTGTPPVHRGPRICSGSTCSSASSCSSSGCSQRKPAKQGPDRNLRRSTKVDTKPGAGTKSAQRLPPKQQVPGVGSRIPGPNTPRQGQGRSRGSESASDSQSESDRSLRRSGLPTRPGVNTSKPQDSGPGRLQRVRTPDISGTKGDRRNTAHRRSTCSEGSRSGSEDARSRSPSVSTSRLPLKPHGTIPKTKRVTDGPRPSTSPVTTQGKKDTRSRDVGPGAKQRTNVTTQSLPRPPKTDIHGTTIVNVTPPAPSKILKKRKPPPPLKTFESGEQSSRHRKQSGGGDGVGGNSQGQRKTSTGDDNPPREDHDQQVCLLV